MSQTVTIYNTNSPAEELPSALYTEKVSNSKKNTTRTKRRMMHNMLFPANICLCSTELIHVKTKLGLIYSK
jgi:hypothetical protein